jgi:hypothetical protein
VSFLGSLRRSLTDFLPSSESFRCSWWYCFKFQYRSIWKPLKGPLTDWPLAVCDARTVEESDLVATDIVRRTVFNENYQVYYNEKQEWWYLSGQRPDEIMVFCQAELGESAKGKFGTSNSRNNMGNKPAGKKTDERK